MAKRNNKKRSPQRVTRASKKAAKTSRRKSSRKSVSPKAAKPKNSKNAKKQKNAKNSKNAKSSKKPAVAKKSKNARKSSKSKSKPRGTKRKLGSQAAAAPAAKKQKVNRVSLKLKEKAQKAKRAKWVGPPLKLSYENEYQSANVNALKSFKVLTKMTARPCTYEKRPPIDVVCVVDRSGSMGGRPLELVKSTLECVTENISEKDRMSIVSFGSDVKTVLPLTNMDKRGFTAANKAIKSIAISGSTALCSALLNGMASLDDLEYAPPGPLRDAIDTGCRAQTGTHMPRWILDIVAQYVQERADIASVFLLTDGEANIGIREPKQIIEAMKGCGAPTAIDGWWKETKGPFDGSFLCVRGASGWYGADKIGDKTPYNYTNVNVTTGYNGAKHVSGRWQWTNKSNHRGSFNWTIAKDGKSLAGRWSFDWDVRNAAVKRGNDTEGEFKAVRVQEPPKYRLGTPVEVKTDKKGWQAAVVSRLPGPDSMMDTVQVRFGVNKQLCDVPRDRMRITKQEKAMPCTINTFGYGAHHNDKLLRDVANVGSGMYYYIDDPAQIDESFGDCLGGLLTMLGKDIRVTIEAAAGVAINKVHTSLACKCIAKNARYEVLVGDIQGEETRDLVVDISLPKGQNMKQTLAYSVKISYYNLLERKNETMTTQVHIPRAKLKVGKKKPARALNVDVQCNRMLVAGVLAEAAKAQGEKDIKKAKAKVTKTISTLKGSVSKGHATTKGLVKDLEQCKSKMENTYTWRSVGSKCASKFSHSHTYQRSTVGSSAYLSPRKGECIRSFKGSMRGKGHRV